MDRLLREGNPPAGQLASPKPQYKDVQTNNWEELKGEGGASYVKDKDVFAKLEQARALLAAISGKDFATQTTLAAVLAKLADLESELATIKANQLSGDQKVQLSGTIDKLIKEFVDVPIDHTTWNFGETVGVFATPLDISAYTDITVVIRNTGEEACKLWAVEGFGPSTTKRIFINTNNGQRWVIPAGASLTLTKKDIPEFGDPVLSLKVQFFDNLSTYNTKVSLEVYGRVR